MVRLETKRKDIDQTFAVSTERDKIEKRSSEKVVGTDRMKHFTTHLGEQVPHER